MSSKNLFSKPLPLIPLKDTVIFPKSISSIYINNEKSQKIVEKAYQGNKLLFLSCLEKPQRDSTKVYKLGCISSIMRLKKPAQNRFKILVQGIEKAKIEKINKDFVFLSPVTALEVKLSKEQELLMKEMKEILDQLTSLKPSFSYEIVMVLKSIDRPSQFCDMLINSLDIKTQDLQKFLEIEDIDKKIRTTLNLLKEQVEMSAIEGKIQKMIKTESPYPFSMSPGAIHPQNFNSYKKQEAKEYKQKLEQKDLPQVAKKEALKQLSRLEKMHTESSEASIIRNYLDWILDLPWNHSGTDHLDLDHAKKVLDEDHLGLEKVKERILEFLAVCHLKSSSLNGPILCFSGPPGVGKTSLGKSIARALGKSYHRISLGGLKDEAEIRGHRRTYIGSMPGKIVQALKSCGTNNPVIVLDEIDKVCSDFKGDPSSALLEVLDPEQNKTFRDHYLNLDFDLSKVFFIATANMIHNIPPALKDRLEVISLSGYTLAEKKKIAQKLMIEKELKNNGLPEKHVSINDQALSFLIQSYTKEAGLRNLGRQLAGLCRKTAKKFVLGDKEPLILDQKKIMELLGSPAFHREEPYSEPKIGIAMGLAWTEMGGEILPVEGIKVKGAKFNLILTGKLGEIMKESAQAALSYVKAYVQVKDLQQISLDKNEIHIHVPGGAIPKDGPSAGVALASSLLSLITGTPIKNNLAMTGEITLSGRVLPVGGIREKVLAAFNSGIETVILPYKNKKNLESLSKEVKEKMRFVLVSDLSEVFKEALLFEPAQRNPELENYIENKEMESVA